MKICEATTLRIQELRKEKRMTVYSLIYQSGMPASTVKSILSGKSKNPGIVNIEKIAEGLGDRKSTRLNSSHRCISYAVFCLKKIFF